VRHTRPLARDTLVATDATSGSANPSHVLYIERGRAREGHARAARVYGGTGAEGCAQSSTLARGVSRES